MKKRKEFRHLTEHDRDRIQALYVWGHKQKEIAEVVEVSPGTISRELQRYDKKTWRYSAKRAKEDAREKRAESKRPGRNPTGSLPSGSSGVGFCRKAPISLKYQTRHSNPCCICSITSIENRTGT